MRGRTRSAGPRSGPRSRERDRLKWSRLGLPARPLRPRLPAMTERDDSTRQALRARLRELIADARAGRPPAQRARRSAERWGVARMTVRSATDALVAEGLVERRHGSGTYVLPPAVRALPRSDVVHPGHARPRPGPAQPPAGLRRPRSRWLPRRAAAGRAPASRSSASPACVSAAASRWRSRRSGSRPRSCRASRPPTSTARCTSCWHADTGSCTGLGTRDHRARAARPGHPAPPRHPGRTRRASGCA